MSRFALLFSLVVASGCVETSQPLSDPITSEVDESLYGHWVLTEERDGKTLETHFFTGKHSVKDNPESIMEVKEVTWNRTDNKVSGTNTITYFTISKIGNETYMNLFRYVNHLKDVDLSGDDSYEKWAQSKDRRCTVVRYRKDKDVLQIWPTESIKAGENLLKANEIRVERGVVDTGSLARYLRKNGGAKLFNGKPLNFKYEP